MAIVDHCKGNPYSGIPGQQKVQHFDENLFLKPNPFVPFPSFPAP